MISRRAVTHSSKRSPQIPPPLPRLRRLAVAAGILLASAAPALAGPDPARAGAGDALGDGAESPAAQEPELPPGDPPPAGDLEAPPPVAEKPAAPLPVAGDVKAPVKISATPPQYTLEARIAGIQGTVVMKAVIDKKGDVTDVEVLQGLPYGLTESAVAAVKSWKFEPATLNGEPVDVYYSLTVNFRLEGYTKPSIKAGFAALKEGDYLDAKRVFQHLYREGNGTSQEVVLGLALAARGLEDAERAELNARRLLALIEGSKKLETKHESQAYAILGWAQQRLGHHKLAEPNLRRALALGAAEARLDLAKVLTAQNKFAEALEEVERYVAETGDAEGARALETTIRFCSGEEVEIPEPLEAGGSISVPTKKRGALPPYTAAARKAKIEGTVLLRAIIDRQGNVRDASIISGLPHGLNEQALAAVREWEYWPAMMCGRPVEVYRKLAIMFRLK